MKIAIFDMDNLKNPFWAAGQARATREVGKRLAKSHKVIVYSSKYPNYKDYKSDGIYYKHIGLGTKSSILNNLAFILTVPLQAKKVDADIIVENFNAPTSVSFAPLFTKTPVVALPTMFNAQRFSEKYHLPFYLVEKAGMKFYKYMLPYSEIDYSKAKRLNPSIKCKIVTQGVGEEFFRIKAKKPKHILYLSRFDIDQKGVDLLIKAYAKVSNKIKYQLVLAGHGPDEGKIRKLIEKYKLGKQVKIVGPAYGEKKMQLMSEAIFVAFPSRHDQICLWALEALAAGLPLVCFNLPESKWMSEAVSFKAKKFDVNDYAKLLLKATNSQVINPMRRSSRQFAKQFTWEKVAKEFEGFFKEILSN